MKKLLLLLFMLSPLVSVASVDESKTDVYFANGINSENWEAWRSFNKVLRPAIEKEIYNNDTAKRDQEIGKFDLLYNETHGRNWDLFESALQKLPGSFDLTKITELWNILFSDEALSPDSEQHKSEVSNSITSGHKVLVIAHSQGNFITSQLLKNVDGWMSDYIYTVRIGSPENADFGDPDYGQGDSFYWDNDITGLIGGGSGEVFNPVRDVKWVDIDEANTSQEEPAGRYAMQSQIGQVLNSKYRAEQALPSFNGVHSLTFYMGGVLTLPIEGEIDKREIVINPFTNQPLSTNVGRDAIIGYIRNGLDELEQKPSQWKKSEDISGCLCEEKRIKVAHKFDESLNYLMADEELYDFAGNSTEGKVYPVFAGSGISLVATAGQGNHVRAPLGGGYIDSSDSGDVCYLLKDDDLRTLASISGEGQSLNNLPSGLFTAQLSWNQPEVSLSMSNSLMSERASGCGVTALGSGERDLFSVYPGTYPITVTAQGYEALNDVVFSDLVTLNVKVPSDRGLGRSQSETLVTNASQYTNLGSGGHVADILITRSKPNQPPEVDLIPSLPSIERPRGGYGYSRPYVGGGSGGGNWWGWRGYYGGGGISTLQTTIYPPVTREEPKLCKPKKSCGCLPCDFAALHYLNQAKLGPISGANVVLYKATEAHKVDKEILFEGLTSISTKIVEAGIISLPVPRPGDLPETTDEVRLMSSILNYDGDFILELSGGVDIDRDDDLVVDSQFTPVNGKLRLILSKESLLNNDFKVNILTELAYQLSKDLLGDDYDKARLQSRLDDIAKRVLIEKLYPDAEQPLGRKDLFYWVPAAHKNWLLKDYDSWLVPIVNKVYLGEDLYTDAYEFVYGEAQSDTVPLLQSQWFKVDEGTASGEVVGQIDLISVGGSDITHYVLLNEADEPCTRFSIDALGAVTLNAGVTLDYETDKIYQLQLSAVNSFGESKAVTLVVLVGNVLDSPEDTGFSGGLIPENAKAGDVIGVITFTGGNNPIERIEVGGVDQTWFVVDVDGSIRLTELAQLDYETKNTASITVQAFNALGSSRVVPLSFEISDTADDAPLVKHLTVSLSEDAVAGDVVGQMVILSNTPLQSVTLAGNGAENFTIDLNGEIRVSDTAQLDYESRINYVLSVIAEDTLGESRKGSVLIKMDNEIDVPKLKRTVLNVLENSAVDTVVGVVSVDNLGTSPITQFDLSGVGSEHFAIDTAGKITLLNNQLNRTEEPFFNLKAVAYNDQGVSLPVYVVVYIDTQRPILGVLRSYNFENATAGTSIGQIPLVSTGSEITALRIEGEGADKFNVDLNRNVTVAEGAEFDFETQTEFTFRVIATNSFGESDPVPLYIQVADVDDSIRIAGASFSVNEDTPSSSMVGQLTILGLGGRTLSHFVITGAGSEWFSIDNTGGIHTTASANFNRSVTSSYRLSVVAIDTLGLPSNTATLDVFITDSLNTAPLLTNASLSLMDTQTAGTVVGRMNISSPVTVIEQVWLEGAGSAYFSIDHQGFISLVKPLEVRVFQDYALTVYAKNAIGISLPARLDINITTEMDITPSTVLELSALTTGRDTTPDYSFSTNEAGLITYSGSCMSTTTEATTGSNTITFNALGEGSYSDCTIAVTDAAGNTSTPLAVTAFTIDTTAPTIAELIAVRTPSNNVTPDYAFTTSESGFITYGGSCLSSATDAREGRNWIELNTLEEGTYSDCTIAVTDVAGNTSTPIAITAFSIDTTAPVVLEVNAVPTPGGNTTADYTFSTNEAGSIVYGGRCLSASAEAVSGNNTVTFTNLKYGTYSDCTIMVTDRAGNTSTPLAITEFVINSSANDFVMAIEVDRRPLTFTIPTSGEGYNYNVDCNNDGLNEATEQTGDYTCIYATSGTYTIRIKDNSGEGTGFPRIYFNNSGDYNKLLSIEQWGAGKWTSMEGAFFGANRMEINASDMPDISGVTNMSSMFERAHAFNQDIGIGNWDTSNITDMSRMFSNASTFNQDLSRWDTSNVTDMTRMFLGAIAFNQNIGNWDTSNVTDMSWMFGFAYLFNQDIGRWDTSSVTDMSSMFERAHAFNQNMDNWNTLNVTSMSRMFRFARAFNQDIGNWNTSNVTDMSAMFRNARFNQDIGRWDTSSVTDMSCMFCAEESVNPFNQDIGNWDVSSVMNMGSMFWNATAFNQDIGAWSVMSLTHAGWMFSGVTLSTENYDSLLTGWGGQILKNNVPFDGGNATYCEGEAARNSMVVTYNWAITDGGKVCGQ